MKKVTTIVTEEFDENGTLKNKITETTTEEDNGYIYPQIPIYPNPWYPTTGNPVWTNTNTTCEV